MKIENKLLVVHQPVNFKSRPFKDRKFWSILSSQSLLKLVRAVWFYISKYRCQHGFDGPRHLAASSFEIKDNGDKRRYAKMTHQAATKKSSRWRDREGEC